VWIALTLLLVGIIAIVWFAIWLASVAFGWLRGQLAF